jgi:hypothetical protein
VIELGLLVFVAFAVLAVITVAGVVLKTAFWLLFLPIRLIFWLVMLPLLIVKGVLGGIVMLVLAPIVALVVLASLIAAAIAIVVPLLPLIAIGVVIWLVVRSNDQALVVTGR